MIKISASVCVDAPASGVWAALSKLEAIHLWGQSIKRSYCVGERSRGLSAVRVCELDGKVTVRETMAGWSEGRSITYSGEGIPMVKRSTNTWSVEDLGTQSLLTASAEVEVRGGMLGRLLEPLLVYMARRMGRRSLASFKYLVEHGRPPEPRLRKRLPAPAVC